MGGFDNEIWDVAVVGGGLGGLTAGLTAARAGARVLALEKNGTVGGNASTITSEGFTFERALHQLYGMGTPGTAPNELLRRLGVLDGLEFLPTDPMLKAVYPGLEVSFPSDVDELSRELKRLFPDSARELARALARLRRMVSSIYVAKRLMRGGELWASRVKDFSSLRKLSGALYGPVLASLQNATFADISRRAFSDETLRAVLGSLWLYLGLPPSKVSGVMMLGMLGLYHLEGSFYIQGGSAKLSEALAAGIKDAGGEIVTGCQVLKIQSDKGRVTGVVTGDGDTVAARAVIHNGDVRRLCESMLDWPAPPPRSVAQTGGLHVSVSTYRLMLGVEWQWREGEEPDYETAYFRHLDHDRNFQDILDGHPDAVLDVCVPTLLDPSQAPPGCHTVIMTTLTPAHDPEYWRLHGETMKQRLLARLEQLHPGITGAIKTSVAITPDSLEKRTLVHRGAMYGWANSPGQSMLNRLPHKIPLKGLYLAGHWTQPGTGMTAVMQSGYLAAGLALRQIGTRRASPSTSLRMNSGPASRGQG